MSFVPPSHRKRVKHFHEPGDLHELTFSTYRRLPLLTNDVWRGWLAEAITLAGEKQNCRPLAFVFMPEHVHLLVLPVNIDWKWSSARWLISDRSIVDPDLPRLHGPPPEMFS